MTASRNQAVFGLVNLLSDLTEAQPESLFGVDLTADGSLSGYFSQGNELFEFRLSDRDEFSYVESDDRDSRSYLAGIKTQDSRELRTDRKSRCEKGKPCGDICIPRGHRCTQGLSKQQKTTAQETKAVVQEQKNKGTWKKGLLIGGAIGLGALSVAGVGAAIVASSSTSSFQRPPAPKPPSTPTSSIPNTKGADPQGQNATNALSPAPDRLTNTTRPIVNPTLIVPPKEMETISDPWTEEIAELPPQQKSARQATSESSTSHPKTKKTSFKTIQKSKQTEIPANPGKKPPLKPLKPEIEQQTDRFVHDLKHYATGAKLVTESQLNPSAIAEAEKTLYQLEVRHRQMMNPLQESYFETAAKEVKLLTKQLAKSDRDAFGLKARLLRGKSLEQHQQESDRALSQLDEHSKRLQFAQAALGSDKKSKGRDRALANLQQQRDQIDGLRSQVVSVQQAAGAAVTLQPKLKEMRQRVEALPLRPGQLSETAQAQHRQVQRIRTLQGKMPGRVAEFAKAHSAELDELDKQIGSIDQITTDHDTNRQFGTQSIQGLIERRRNLIEQDMHRLRLMAGKDGLNWVMSKDVSDVTNEMGLAIGRVQRETGMNQIATIEDAAKFRDHVMTQLNKRVEKYLTDIETRSVYPQEVSSKAVDQANAQLADLHELQKTAVIEGRQTSQGLVRDLQRTAQGTEIQLAGSAVQQPYRQAHEFLVQDIQNAHAQKARAMAEAIVAAQSQRDRLARLAKEPAVFEMGGVVKSADQLGEDVAAVRAEIKRMKQVTTVKLGNVRPTDETKRRMAAGEQRMAQNEVVKAQINHLQTQLGDVAQQIKKREEAAARGQKKGIATGRLEAQRAAIRRQMEDLAQHFEGIEKRDRA